MDAVTRLCHGASVEEKVAGLLLLHQSTAAGASALDRAVVADVLSAVGGTPFFTELLSSSRFTSSSVPKNARKAVERAAVGFLAQCATWDFLSATEDALALVDAWFIMAGGGREDLQELVDLLLVVRLAAKDPAPAQRMQLLDCLLQRAHTQVATQSLPARTLPLLLDLVADLAPAAGNDGGRVLSDAAADAVRLLLTAGFHGGAPEDVRDAALSCCQQLLAAGVDAAWTKEPAGTTAASPPSEQSTPPSPSPSNPPSNPEAPPLPECGRFAVLLMTVVGVEVHLLLEETVALATEPVESATNSTSEATAAPTAETKEKSVERATDLRPEVAAQRCARAMKVLPCCFMLLSHCLTLLVGRGSIDEEEDEDEAYGDGGGWWASLPGPAVLRVRESAHSTLKQLLDFLRDCPSGAAATGGALSAAQVAALVSQAAAALSLWTCEDAALHRPYVDGLSSLLRWSQLTTSLDDHQALSVVADHTDTDATAGDVIHHVAPCLAAIADDLSADGEDDNDDAADTADATTGAAADRDRLCTAAPALLGMLLHVIAVGTRHADRIRAAAAVAATAAQKPGVAATTMDMATASGLLRLGRTAAAACGVLAAMLDWKGSDLAALRRGEGDDAALRAVFVAGRAADALPCLPGPASVPYLRRLGDALAVASGRLVGADHPVTTALDRAMCHLLLVLDE